MAPAKQCAECNGNEKNAKFIKCGNCDLDYHISCAAKKNPSLNETMLESINKSKGGMVFKCWSCLDKPKPKTCENDISSKLSELEATIKKLSKTISEDIIEQLKDIKSEVASCSLKVKATDTFVTSKIQHLEHENNSLRRQINRSDIVVHGLSAEMTVDEMHNTLFEMGKVLDVEINHNDVNLCTYIRRKKSMLVKFNSIYKRDMLMKKYFAYNELKLCQIYKKTKAESRVYLNDNLTPCASKLNYLCRKLLKDKKITKFRFYNRDTPEAKIFLPGGAVKLLNFEKMTAFIKSNTEGGETEALND